MASDVRLVIMPYYWLRVFRPVTFSKRSKSVGRIAIFLAPIGCVDSLRDVPPPSSFPGLSRAELEALLVGLFGEIAALKQTNSELREEIARLKGLKGRPDIKPSGMDKVPASEADRRKKQRPR